MRRLGSALMAGGVVLGAGVGVAMLAGFHFASLPWIVAVGLTKLTLIASGGLIAAGAVCHRLARREEQRQALPRARDADRPSLR